MTKELKPLLQGPPTQGAFVRIKSVGIDVAIIVNDEIDWEIVQRTLLACDRKRYGKSEHQTREELA